MTYINKNIALNQLEELIQTSIKQKEQHLPDSFVLEQKKAIEIFNKRILLESIIEETIAFNKNLNWTISNENIGIATNAEDLIDVYKLRSDVYTELHYDKEFPDIIEGLNFDEYDKNAAIIYSRTNGEISGTGRLIFDSGKQLPTEKKVSFEKMREKYNIIGEISRLIIKKKDKGLNLDFKNIMKGIHNVFNNNDIDTTISIIKEDHYKLYSKFGGIGREKELFGFGELTNSQFLIISWDPSKASKFFKRAFLNE